MYTECIAFSKTSIFYTCYLIPLELDEEWWMENHSVQTKDVSRHQEHGCLIQNEGQSILRKRFRQISYINFKKCAILYSYYLINIVKCY